MIIYAKNGKDLQKQAEFHNTGITRIFHCDQDYVYCLCDSQKEPIKRKIMDKDADGKTVLQERGTFNTIKKEGLYVLSASKLFEDLQPRLYRLSDGVVGANDLIDFCPISQRISFMLSF